LSVFFEQRINQPEYKLRADDASTRKRDLYHFLLSIKFIFFCILESALMLAAIGIINPQIKLRKLPEIKLKYEMQFSFN
jgi:hypothetical protein